MRQDESYPAPVSDPASEGIPEYADDDSTAYDDVDSPRVADGPSPAPLPADRDEGPVGLDDVATTAEGQRRGGSLEDRLAEEEPDISPEADEVAQDAGAAGGGASAEELAMHAEPEE